MKTGTAGERKIGLEAVILAFAPAEVLDEVLAQDMLRFTEQTPTESERVLTDIMNAPRGDISNFTCGIEAIMLVNCGPLNDPCSTGTW